MSREGRKSILQSFASATGLYSGRRKEPLRLRSSVCSCIVILAAGLLVYLNSFRGQFIFDGLSRIVEQPALRRLWPAEYLFIGDLRPLVYLSFALNYATGQYEVFGYHLVNLGIHLCAGLTLYGILRRTFENERIVKSVRERSNWLALVTALIWVVHPLQTESVTYIFQRSESLAGLFYLLTLYCSIRFFSSGGIREGLKGPILSLWSGGATLFCVLGMVSKPVVVTAPVMVLIYDRVFFGRGFVDIFRTRGKFYLALSLSWLLLLGMLVRNHDFGATVTSWEYAKTQPGVILHYMKLVFWPDPLVIDYQWPVATGTAAVIFPALLMLFFVVLTVLALKVCPGFGFLGIWFF